MEKFIIENFGLIKNVSISFGDLTLLVGPQASGKSIALETLKLAIDRDHIINTLDRYNYIIGHNTDKILNVYFGEGMSGIWKDNTHIEYDDISFLKKNFFPVTITNKMIPNEKISIFFPSYFFRIKISCAA